MCSGPDRPPERGAVLEQYRRACVDLVTSNTEFVPLRSMFAMLGTARCGGGKKHFNRMFHDGLPELQRCLKQAGPQIMNAPLFRCRV